MDPVANMLVTIKNGYMAKKPEVALPFSKFKMEIAKVLQQEGFVGEVKHEDSKINIALVYKNQKPRLTDIQKVSKLGMRIYSKSKNLKKVKGGLGVTIVSTPKGVMTAAQAKQKNLGGEVICKLW